MKRAAVRAIGPLAPPFLSLLALWPGTLLAAVVAVAASFIADLRGGPVMLYALLIGMALNDISGLPRFQPGIAFASRTVLRAGVAMLGARITVHQFAALGWRDGLMVILGVAATIGFGIAASKALGLSRRTGVLTGGATAICGASAAIAIASVLPRDEQSERELLFTVAGVTALSTVAMIVYPPLVLWLGMGPEQAGLFLGGTIHDVAQVVGAAYSISRETGDAATLTKMLRVALLLPVVLVITVAVRHGRPGAAGGRVQLPGFLLVFAGLIVLSSLGWVPAQMASASGALSRACLVMAIAAVGLKTRLSEVTQVGARAMLLLGAETLFLAIFVFLSLGGMK